MTRARRPTRHGSLATPRLRDAMQVTATLRGTDRCGTAQRRSLRGCSAQVAAELLGAGRCGAARRRSLRGRSAQVAAGLLGTGRCGAALRRSLRGRSAQIAAGPLGAGRCGTARRRSHDLAETADRRSPPTHSPEKAGGAKGDLTVTAGAGSETRAQPSSSRAQPSSSRAQPSSSRTQPSSTGAQPSSSRAQPSSSRTQPSKRPALIAPRVPGTIITQPPASQTHSTHSPHLPSDLEGVQEKIGLPTLKIRKRRSSWVSLPIKVTIRRKRIEVVLRFVPDR